VIVPTLKVVKDGQTVRINESDLIAWEDRGWKPEAEVAKPDPGPVVESVEAESKKKSKKKV